MPLTTPLCHQAPVGWSSRAEQPLSAFPNLLWSPPTQTVRKRRALFHD